MRPTHPATSAYGQVLLAKLALFGLALGAASVNHFGYLRRWRLEPGAPAPRGFRRAIGWEFILILFIFGVTGYLTRMAPPQP